MVNKNAILKEYFGHLEFREGQEKVVDSILANRDVLCVMPTGAGKSICYQVPALMLDGVTLVISPLISLMKDQVNALEDNGIPAAFLNSALSGTQYFNVLSGIRLGVYKLIYVAPERLVVSDFLDACSAVKISLLAIDEAHCISQWGQDFRPSYLKIAEFTDRLGYRPTIAAFTATATQEVKDDIEYSLKLRNPFRITTGFDRPNLRFGVMKPKNKNDALLEFLSKHTAESGIIYCSTRRTVEEVASTLIKEGYEAAMYHAGLEDEIRKQNQEDFVYDRKNIMVATNAFGMGIDKSNVSYVVHYNMPKDIESYYQEAGRAGRDGAEAECILLYSPADVQTNRFLIENSELNPDLTHEQQELLSARDHDRLKQMTFYSTANTCLRRFILEYFGERAPSYCGNCSNCLTSFEEVDITVDAQKILSCIKRTGEHFGKKMITDILRGSRGERLLRLGLDSQSTYGLLKGSREDEVRAMIDHLEFNEYIRSSDGDYPVLTLTPKARGILFGGEVLLMQKAKPKEPSPIKKHKEKYADAPDRGLYAELKALRRQLADERRVPAYIIFSDATLVDMCRCCPETPEELLEVSGVGKVKLKQYGEDFLNVIKTYRRN